MCFEWPNGKTGGQAKICGRVPPPVGNRQTATNCAYYFDLHMYFIVLNLNGTIMFKTCEFYYYFRMELKNAGIQGVDSKLLKELGEDNVDQAIIGEEIAQLSEEYDLRAIT